MMTRTILIAAVAAAAVAGCASHTPAPAPAAARAAAPSCNQQYATWKQGPARAAGKKLVAALDAVQAASTSEDVPVLLSSLKKAGTAAAVSAGYPMPACADPHGYWGQMLARVQGAGDNAGAASGLGGLMLAEAPLKAVPGIQAKLTAELKHTT